MKTKLTDKQQKAIDILKKYPDSLIMLDGYLTSGHGVKFDLRTIKSLERKNIIVNHKLY